MLRDYWSRLKGRLETRPGLSPRFFILLTLSLFIYSPAPYGQDDSLINLDQVGREEQQYSGNIKKRFAAWKKLILSLRSQSVKQKLSQVNDFFNQFQFESDIKMTGMADYWKSPQEFIIDGGGDCEDFAIAKYFTLLAVGIPMSQLRITYVKAVNINQAHMVVTYYPTASGEPLILDNLEAEILPASKRPDLVPVYSFNGDSLWLAKQRQNDQLLGGSSGLQKWQGVIEKMKLEGATP